MRRLGALIGKELRQHALAIIAIALLLLPLEALMLLGAAVSPQNLSYFEVQRTSLLLLLPIVGLVLGNRLVVAEYYGRTQLFLESLPIRRWEPITIKYLLGLFTMVGVAVGLLLVTAAFAFTDEPFDPLFLVIVSCRSIGFVVFLWSFLFLMGFTGRFRMALYVALFFALAAIGQLTEFELTRFGPFSLVDETFPYERRAFPAAALTETMGYAFFFVLAAFALALVGDGSLAEALAKRMSTREKSAVGAALMVGLIAYSTVLDERRQPDPYAFPGGTPLVEAEGSAIQVTFIDEDTQAGAAAALLVQLTLDLRDLPTDLGWGTAPVARVALRETLDGDTFEPVRLAPGDGVLLRANYLGPDADRIGLRAALIRELITAHTTGRAIFEPQRWFLDGYARYRVERALPEAERVSFLRALYMSRGAPIESAQLNAWNRTRETWGAPVAEGLAATAVAVLAEEVGEARIHALARRLYADEVGDNSWVTLRDTVRPFPAVFEQETGLALEAFAASLNAALEGRRSAPWAAVVAAIPEVSAELDIEVVEGQLRAAVAHITQSEAAASATVATLLHQRLEPLDDVLVELELERDDVSWAGGAQEATLRLEGRYGPGERAFFAIEVESETLACPIRAASMRRTIR